MRYIRFIIPLTGIIALQISLCSFVTNKDVGHRIIKQSDGLADNNIRSLERDTLGTLWVGTAKGLNRIYEGHISDYNHDPRLCNKPITFIARDSRNNIWISVQGEGLFKYDYLIDSFHEMKINEENPRPEWYSESADYMWFCSKEGISRFHYGTGLYEMYIPRDWKESRYNGFCMNSDSTALVSSTDGYIYLLNLQTRQRRVLYNFNEDIHVNDFYHDSSDKTWISIHGKGLFRFSSNGIESSFPQGKSFFDNKIILDIQEHDGLLYIATDGAGIFCMDLSTYDVQNIKSIYNSSFPEEINTVSIIYFHDDDMLLGTIRHGIIFQRSRKVRNFKDEDFGSRIENGPNRSVVACMSEDADGNIWIGCDGGGLSIFNPKTGHIKSIEAFKREKVVAIEVLDERYLLLSLYNKGIYRYDIQTGRKGKILIENKNTDERILGQDIIIGLERAFDDKILVLAKSVYEYDKNNGLITDSGIDITGTTNLNLAHLDKSHTWLYSSYELFQVNNRTKQAELLLYDKTGTIKCIKMIDSELFMLSSHSLSRIDRESWLPVEFPFHYNGQLMPVIETDATGNLFVTTKNDIFCIRNTDPQDYIRYYSENELEKYDFLQGVSLTSSSGIIYFGGNSGLCQINPHLPDKTPMSKSIHLLRISVNGKNISHDTKNQNEINIPWNYESIFMDISSEGDDVLKSNKFRYTIREQSKSSVIYSDSRLSLPVMAPGKYKVSIAYLDSSDKWVESDTILGLTITPPWWKNFALLWGILLIIALVTFTSIYLYHKYNRVKAAKIYNKRKEKLAESKMEFITNVSHELKTPLTLIYNPLKRILEKSELESSLRKELNNILGQSKYMTHLINMVIDSRRLEEGFGTLNIGSYDLKSWIENVCSEFISEFENKSIKLKWDTSTPGTLNFDAGKFQIILSNLLMNAWKYSESGTTVSVITSEKDGRVRISVIDEGIGIASEDTEKLFNRFTQGKRAAKGFGLGLAYTKLLVETHPGGRIGAHPNLEKGSTFWFEIPADLQCKSDSPQIHTEITQPISTYEAYDKNLDNDFDTSSYTVLIVEDEINLQAFLRKELSAFFKDIYLASDGVEALAVIKSKRPDIIVSDVMMPNKNGYELCRDIKKDIRISHIPIILLTALDEAENRKAGYKSGADLYLTKPFDTSVLIAASRNVLQNRSIVRERYKNAADIVSAAECTFSDADEKFLVKLDKFIEEHISNEKLNAQMCIEHTCLGRATFYKKIKELTGLGIMEYVTRKRLSIAVYLLTKTQLPISEIAHKIGYPDNQYFSKVFKQNFGMSPREYRNKMI